MMLINRLAGATLMTPVVNYWWHNLPLNMTTKAYYKQPKHDQWALRVAHYFPWLTYWWFTQEWFPSSSVVQRNPAVFSNQDLSIVSKFLINRQQQVIQLPNAPLHHDYFLPNSLHVSCVVYNISLHYFNYIFSFNYYIFFSYYV